MRATKFRGLAIDGSGWVCGLPTYKPWGLCIQHSDEHGKFTTVYPDTVGQYTGLKDKNGKEVFEGDKLNRKTAKSCYQKYGEAFTVEFYKHGFECEYQYGLLEYLAFGDVEVIGTIHDKEATK